MKAAELEDLESFIGVLTVEGISLNIFDCFYVGFTIPQIGKEFDLLRFGAEYVINIELKKISTEEKIQKQLVRNRYYLGNLCKKVYNFSFIAESKSLFILTDNDDLEMVGFDYLIGLLKDQKVDDIQNVEDLFNPSDFLVSPFNSTQKFLNKQYFLTQQQEDIKTKIINSISIGKTANFVSVVGGAGTGKTLLIYDLVKELREQGKDVLILHCGYLNAGQEMLRQLGWQISQIKYLSSHDLSNFDVVVIDEAQRIYPVQLDQIVNTLTMSNGNCIFSYDKRQTLAKSEEAHDIDGKISNINSLTKYKLTEKIRTNKEIALFIKMLFNNQQAINGTVHGSVEVNYFQNVDDAKRYLESIDTSRWEVLRFTPSQFNREHHDQYSEISAKTSHKVIGQEFDGVVVTIDRYFTYNQDGELTYLAKAYYYPVKMLFQNMTRARKRINLVIINNEELLNRCIAILQ
ncbi:ATP-binding protein [Undibacterium sp. KW1]|uniref:ATP-binding protein n=1 Tax=Undibacterium sp. KW1 TaxID=2058624 RepID=UPI00138A4A2F|nr:ATP-binding protein [Undibacterium sp. KW1]